MQIINPSPRSNTITIDECDFSKNKFYGVQMPSGRGFIRQESYHTGQFAPYCINGFTYSNLWDSFCRNSIKEVVCALFENAQKSDRKIEVHVFDTFAELAAFLVDEKSGA